MLVRKNRLAVTADAKNRTVGFPDEFAKQVATILSAEKNAIVIEVAGKTSEIVVTTSGVHGKRK